MLATRRAKAAGFQPNWQIFVDRKGIIDVAALVEMARRECDALPQISIPAHRVGGRLWHFEPYRPSLKDICKWRVHQIIDDPHKNDLINPEELTTIAWIEMWKKNPESEEFKHVFEPRLWPPSLSHENLTIRIQRDRVAFLDPMCSSPIRLGYLSEGKDLLIGKISRMPPPANVDITPHEARFLMDEQEQLHPYGMSVRYKAISNVRFHKGVIPAKQWHIKGG